MLSAFAPDFGMGDDLARAAAIFGGGVARTGGMCGGITGALMVLGFKYGMVVPEDQETKEKGYEIAKEFLKKQYVYLSVAIAYSMTIVIN